MSFAHSRAERLVAMKRVSREDPNNTAKLEFDTAESNANVETTPPKVAVALVPPPKRKKRQRQRAQKKNAAAKTDFEENEDKTHGAEVELSWMENPAHNSDDRIKNNNSKATSIGAVYSTSSSSGSLGNMVRDAGLQFSRLPEKKSKSAPAWKHSMGAVLLFWCLSTLLLAFYSVPSAIFISESVPSAWPHAQPTIQNLFLLGCGFLSAMFTTFASGEKGLRLNIALGLFYASFAIFFAFRPDIALLVKGAPGVELFSMGNCTSLQSSSLELRKNMGLTCPRFDPGEAFVISNFESLVGDSGTQSDLLSRGASVLGRLALQGPLLSHWLKNYHYIFDHDRPRFPDLQKYPGWWEAYLLHSDCFPKVSALGCEVAVSRCNFATCKPSGENCFISLAIQEWHRCALNKCNGDPRGAMFTSKFSNPLPSEETLISRKDENASCAAALGISQMRQCIEYFSVPNKALGNDINRTLIDLMGDYEAGSDADASLLGEFLTRMSTNLKHHPEITSDLRRRTFAECRAQTWANGTDSGTKQSEISCDPLRREYQVESSVLSFDSSAALLVAFSILTIMVAVRGRYQPVRKTVCSSRRIRNAVAVNVFFGLLTSWFLYTAAVNFERSALLLALSGKDNAAAGARATSFVYFSIAFAVLHHSVYFLHYDHSRRQKQWKAKKKRVKNCLLCKSCRHKTTKSKEKGSTGTKSALKRRTTDLKSVIKETMKTQGRFYAFYMLLREVAECSIQFAGLQQMCGRADVGIVKARAFLLSANLILLPLIIWAADKFWGQVVAIATFQVAEKLFDKSFVVAGVVFQIVAGEANEAAMRGSALSQFAFHAPVLVPALLALANPKSSIVSLLISTDKRETRRKNNAAARIQKFVRRKLRPANQKSRSSVFWEVVLAVTRENADAPVRDPNTFPMKRCWKRCDAKQTFFWFTGVTFIVIGASLMIFVAVSIHLQSLVCVATVGDAAEFLYPRVYFSDGLFGRMRCGWPLAVKLSASGAGVQTFPESTSAYEQMTKLTSIDLSFNPELVRVPASFAAIPNLQSLSLSGCSRFQDLPFALCLGDDNNSPLQTLGLDGTLAEQQLDWSGQLAGLSRRKDKASISSPQLGRKLSSACSRALQSSLQRLDLSNNSLRCPERSLGYSRSQLGRDFLLYRNRDTLTVGKAALRADACDFAEVISPLRELQTLDLSGNSIRTLLKEFWEATSFVILNVNDTSSGLIMTGNPIESMELSGWSTGFAKQVIRGLGRDRIDLRALSLNFISGKANSLFDTIQEFPGLCKIEVLALSHVGVTKEYPGVPRLRDLKTLWLTQLTSGKNYGFAKAWFSSSERLQHLLVDRCASEPLAKINSSEDFAVPSRLHTLAVPCGCLDIDASGFLKNLEGLDRLVLDCDFDSFDEIRLCRKNSSNTSLSVLNISVTQRWGVDATRTEVVVGNLIEDAEAPNSYTDKVGWEAWTKSLGRVNACDQER